MRGPGSTGRISRTANPLLAWLAQPTNAVDAWLAANNEDPGLTSPLKEPVGVIDYMFLSPEWPDGRLACSVSRVASEMNEDHAQLWARLPAPWQQHTPHAPQPPRGPPRIRWDALSKEDRQAIIEAVERRCPAPTAGPAAEAAATPPPTTDDDDDDDDPAQPLEGAAATLNGDNFQQVVAEIARGFIPRSRGRQRGKPRSRISQTRWVRIALSTALRRTPRDWGKLAAALAAARELTSPHIKRALVDQAREWCAALPRTPERDRPGLEKRINTRCLALVRKLREANGQEAGWRQLTSIATAIEAREAKFRTDFGPIGRRLVKGARQSAGISRVIHDDAGTTVLETNPETVMGMASAHFDKHFAVRDNNLDDIPPEWRDVYEPRTDIDYSAVLAPISRR
ncbi:hypothetical protein IWQ56_001927, partial [Coemansia nantahalensis]